MRTRDRRAGPGAAEHPSRPLQVTTRGGEPALLVPRWDAPLRLGRWLLAGTVSLFAVTALWLGLSGHGLPALAWGLGALVLLAVVVRGTVSMPSSGGVWLTPTRLAHRLGRDEWSLSWGEVADLVPDGDDLRVVTRDGHEHVARAHLLVTDLRTVAALVDAYRSQPARRDSLGTEESLAFAEQGRAALQPPDFRVSLHGALPRTRQGLVLAVVAAAVVVAVVLLALAALETVR